MAQYKCLKCHHEWQTPRPKGEYCVACGHPYVKWVNYEKWLKLPGKSAKFRKALYG